MSTKADAHEWQILQYRVTMMQTALIDNKRSMCGPYPAVHCTQTRAVQLSLYHIGAKPANTPTALLALPSCCFSPALPVLCCAQLGVPLPTQREFITKGTVRHDKKGKIGISREEGNVTFSRSSLAQYLIGEHSTTAARCLRRHSMPLAAVGWLRPCLCYLAGLRACMLCSSMMPSCAPHELGRHLLPLLLLPRLAADQARQRYPSQITFHFDSACAGEARTQQRAAA
jgi:hypothetical protein